MTNTETLAHQNKITHQDTEALYLFPASFAQQRLWFVDQLEPNSPAYNVPLAVRIQGNLKVDALTQSIQEIVARHETLRTTFFMHKGQLVQAISPVAETNLVKVDLSNLTETAREAKMQQLAKAEAQQPFDLSHGPLLRTSLLALDVDDHVLLLTLHHIICDGWSMGVFINEMTILYDAFANGLPSPLPELPIQYADFSEWQREWLSGAVLEKQHSFWRHQLGQNLSTLNLPTDFPRPPVQASEGAKEMRIFDAVLSEPLQALSQETQGTLYMTLLAAFKVLLHYKAQQDDIVVGTDIANRNQADLEGLISIFVNQLVMRTNLAGDPSFRALIGRVREVVLGAYEHQDLPFDKLVEDLNPARDPGRSPLFQVKFVFQNTPTGMAEHPDLTLTPLELLKGTARFDLLLTMRETAHGLVGVVEYRTDLFKSATISQMLAQFEALLTTIIAQPDAKLSTLVAILAEADKQQLQAQEEAFDRARRDRARRGKRTRVKPKPVTIQ